MSDRNKIKAFLTKRFLEGRDTVSDDESFYERDIIDSLGMLELIGFVQKTFQISISPTEVTIDNFDSVNRIMQLIERKRGQRPGP